MKRCTIFALGAASAFAIVLAIGAGVASATVLCKKAEATCAVGNRYPAGTNVNASLAAGTVIRIRAEFANIECKKSTLNAKTSNEGKAGERVAAAISTETFSECEAGQTVTVKSDGKLEFEFSSALVGTGMAFVNNENSITVKVGATECTYGASVTGKPIMVNGSGTAPTYTMTDAETQLVKTAGGVLCASAAKLNATYNIGAPTELFVVEK